MKTSDILVHMNKIIDSIDAKEHNSEKVMRALACAVKALAHNLDLEESKSAHYDGPLKPVRGHKQHKPFDGSDFFGNIFNGGD